MSPIAALAWTASLDQAPNPTNPALRMLGNRTLARLALLAAAGELVGDKLPMAPKRTIPAALLWRMVLGSLCGWVVATQEKQPTAWGLGLGGLAALWSAYAATAGRVTLTEAGLPDIAVALTEDLLTFALCLTAMQDEQVG